jgi:cell wall-associated NlpC family hydrolase
MNVRGHEQKLGQTDRPTKRFTNTLVILFSTIFTLCAFTATAGATEQNENFYSNPFPNPKTLMKLTTTSPTAAALPSSVISATIPVLNSSVTTTVTANDVIGTIKRTVVANESLGERRQNVAWFAASYSDFGFKYQLGSASIENGAFDCSGFVTYVLNYFDIKTKRTAAEQYTEGKQVAVEEARAGDLVFFGGKNSVSHVAMVVSNDAKGLVVVHSTNTKGVTQENITESKYWKPKLKERAVNILGE